MATSSRLVSDDDDSLADSSESLLLEELEVELPCRDPAPLATPTLSQVFVGASRPPVVAVGLVRDGLAGTGMDASIAAVDCCAAPSTIDGCFMGAV